MIPFEIMDSKGNVYQVIDEDKDKYLMNNKGDLQWIFKRDLYVFTYIGQLPSVIVVQK